jgi:HD-like signal output (HDOD) protein
MIDAQGTWMQDISIDAVDADEEIVKSIIECIDQLPSLPLVVQRILQLVDREQTSAKEIGDVIALDPALAARVLRLVNSAMYGLTQPVTTIQHAVALLGFSEVKNLTLGLKVMETLTGAQTGALDPDRFWEHSLACGLCARGLAMFVPQLKPDEAFLGGLLHDIGKVVLATYFQEQWETVQERAARKQSSPIALEKELVGVTHPLVGEWLAAHWRIPELHRLALRYHHEIPPGETHKPVDRLYCAVAFAANSLVRWLDVGTSGYSNVNPIPPHVLNLIGLSESRVIEQCMQRTLNELIEWKRTLGVQGERAATADDEDGAPAVKRMVVVSPKKDRVPTIQTLLKTLGAQVQTLRWGNKPIDAIAAGAPEAIVMDLRGLKIEAKKLLVVLKAVRARSSAPVLVVLSRADCPDLPCSLEDAKIVCLRGEPPHRENLNDFLQMCAVDPQETA